MVTSATSSLIAQLNHEWTMMCASADMNARVAEWARRAPTLDTCASLSDVASLVHTSTSTTQDTVLGELLRIGQDGDHVAMRTVFQMFLGAAIRAGLSPVRVATRTYDEVAQDLADALWEAVATYPLDRRPVKIAANVKMEIVRRLSARYADRCTAEVPVDPATTCLLDRPMIDDTVTSPVEDVLEVIAWAVDAAVISRHDAALLVEVYCPAPDQPGGAAAAAARRGLSPAAVRKRCSRTVRTLSTFVELTTFTTPDRSPTGLHTS